MIDTEVIQFPFFQVLLEFERTLFNATKSKV